MQTDSPGRNRNAFFGLKRKNDAVCPTTNKRPRLEDKEHNLEKESESTISSDLLNFEMDEALDDWLLGETTTEGTIELETGFVM